MVTRSHVSSLPVLAGQSPIQGAVLPLGPQLPEISLVWEGLGWREGD